MVSLLQVLYDGDDGCNPCRVALAAEQGRLCGRGEQLRLTPFGKGVCDCRDGHERWAGDQVTRLNLVACGEARRSI